MSVLDKVYMRQASENCDIAGRVHVTDFDPDFAYESSYESILLKNNFY